MQHGNMNVKYTWFLSVLAREMHYHRTLAFRAISCPLSLPNVVLLCLS
jgi:hypothetical protein